MNLLRPNLRQQVPQLIAVNGPQQDLAIPSFDAHDGARADSKVIGQRLGEADRQAVAPTLNTT